MLLAESANLTETLVVGTFGLFLVLAFWIRSLVARRVRSESAVGPTTSELLADVKLADRESARVDRFEIRLHEYSRDVEARMESRLARLDRLVVSADREICRLQDLLEKKGKRAGEAGPDIVPTGTSNAPNADGRMREPLTSWQQRMVAHLRDAGYSAKEIAVLLDRPESEITAALEFERQSQPRGAA